MRHSQAFVVILMGLTMAFALAIWAGSLWGALGLWVAGLVVAFVISMAWMWTPRSGIGRGRRPTDDSSHEPRR